MKIKTLSHLATDRLVRRPLGLSTWLGPALAATLCATSLPLQAQVTTLATHLQGPNSLWVQRNKVYLTETAGRNTSFGGNIRLDVFDLASKQLTVLMDHPVNSDAVVVTSDNVIYLTSYYDSIPGETGGVSYLESPYTNEIQLLDLEIASEDMCIDEQQNIFIIGSSDWAGAKSLYKLPAGNYGSPVVLQTGLGRTWCIAKTGPYICFGLNLLWGNGCIMRFQEGGSLETFLGRNVLSMSFSSRYLYYADYFGGTIGRVDLNTKADEILLSGLQSPKAVRFERASGNLYFVEFGSSANQYKDGTLKVLFGLESAIVPPMHYVSLGSTNPTPPYTNWVTAATNIQDAVDAAVAGDEIVVGNGTYARGSRVDPTGATSRVAVDKRLTLRSVNGPDVTVIDGSGTVRCVYLTSDAVMVGFTLTNGVAGYGAGAYCESTDVVVSNCVITGNAATSGGGGAYGGMLYNCTLTGNFAGSGGGADGSTLYNCTLTGNSASLEGGGASWGTLYNCTLTGNSAWNGGGAYESALKNGALTSNSAHLGGGAYGGTLINCTLTGNAAFPIYLIGVPGPSSFSVDPGRGGGAYGGTLNNCILSFNTADIGPNYCSDESGNAAILQYCCTTPLPPGIGNIAADPRLTDSAHVSSDSPCVGAGNSNYVSGTDFDGEPWGNPPSIGCDEFHAGPVTGPLTLSIAADYTNVVAGFAVGFGAQINGHALVNFWDFDDGTIAINEAYGLPHSFALPGDYTVTLWAFNDSHPFGVSASVAVHVCNGLHYVSAASLNPVAPYASWATAATNIQDAVDVAGVGGDIVLVTNGTYASGGRVLPDSTTNRVTLDKPVTLLSVNGPQVTVIDGGGTARCVYATSAVTLSGFTLTDGWAVNGGGVYCESINPFSGPTAVVSNCLIQGNSAYWHGGGAYGGTLYNCVITGNSAGILGGGAHVGTLYNCTISGNSSGAGGGAYGGTLYNCTLTGNAARDLGGGAYGGTLYNCTLTGNAASYQGGGAALCALNNSIVYSNTAPAFANFRQGDYVSGSLNFCCTTPQPTGGIGNVTNTPLFIDQANGNLRLQSNSPCINAGKNAYAPGSTDLDGNPRIVSGSVDIGAYEYQGTGSRISYAWLQQYGLPTDGSADFTHGDADGMNNWQEWICGTCPTNEASVLRLLSASPTGTNVAVTWQSVAGVTYFLERGADLASSFTLLATNIPGRAGTTTYADTNAPSLAPVFYRVGVGN